ncbi:MAG: hypothetical protein Q7R95_11455 [bacterium]|nr:hypothetical protein [bacterium]
MRNKNYIEVSGLNRGIDFDAHFKVKQYRGISFYLLGWKANEVENEEFQEIELEADYSTVIAVMVGDDRKHEIDIDDLEPLAEEEFCHSCGQIGCGHSVYA